ncbi:hypothetical protein JCM9534A_26670 [Catenuloplanes indicus JCM 9534]
MTALRRGTLAAAALLATFATVLALRPAGDTGMRAFGDLALTLPPLAAAVAGLVRARLTTGPARYGWLLIGAGCAAWAGGQIVWCWYELVTHRPSPYPSIADLGYLAFRPLVLAGAAMLISRRAGVWRTLLDALIISGSVLATAWPFVLGPAILGENITTLEWVVGVAYPVANVTLLSMVVLLLGHVRPDMRRSVVLLGCGVLALSAAHAVYALLVVTGSYTAGGWVDTGWFGGFLLIALAAVAAPRRPRPDARQDAPGWVVLPYVPLGLALVTSVSVTVRDGEPGTFLYCLTVALVALVTARQLISARDNLVLNRRLNRALGVLRDREAQLEHQAFHDPLTGLANRVLFEERARHAIAHQDRSGEAMALIYIDLDGFKDVNDGLGHQAGDALLAQVATRLTQCVRASDTVARLGGDEFAVLCERMAAAGDDEIVAARIVERLSDPFDLSGTPAVIGASVGLARRQPHVSGLEALLRAADAAMYRAKTTGKGRVSLAEAG